ncbi:unnamed protein product [Peniophora sp. CBMAI 1063]|nr:unnamed protein product [Peniophora sp. CBMAI 1063]
MPSSFLLNSQLYYYAGACCLFLFVAIRYLRRPSLRDIRGPPRSSFWLGNQGDFKYQNEVGDVEFKWLKEFGGAWKVHYPLGGDCLFLADPKALQYVLQTSGYRYPKRASSRGEIRMFLGDGIIWAHGEQHRRHRKIMNPAFSLPQLKSFLPVFLGYSEKLVQKWKEEEITPGAGAVEPIVNVHSWLSRTTLDVIGDAGLGFHFGSLDNVKSELSDAYSGLFIDSTLYPAPWYLVFRNLWNPIPVNILSLLRYMPNREASRFRTYMDYIRKFGRELIAQTRVDNEATSKDITSVLLRANGAEDMNMKLSDRELVDQISDIILAGHDTTSATMAFWLWELGKHPDWQTRVREEIRAARRKLEERGDSGFSLADLEGMSIMHLTLKEAMRLHPILQFLEREAGQDDVIPLAHPIVTKSGEQIKSIPVRKGQAVEIGIASYQRNPEVWGADADAWNPDRFMKLEKEGMTPVDLYANLLNFSAGIRGCIGWKFAVIEMQAIAATLIENFEFALPPQTKENVVRRKPTGIMAPMADGHPGAWMGLKVKDCRNAS